MNDERRIRGGLLALLALVVGLAGLGEGLRWYAGYLERLSAPDPKRAVAVPATTTTATLPPAETNAPPSQTPECVEVQQPGIPLDSLLAQLPDPDDAVWPTHMGRCVCVLEALAGRLDEDPERIAEALFPFALSYPLAPRQPALRGLAKTRFNAFPRWAVRRIEDSWHSGLAVDAAFALRVEELDPERVERWAFDPDDRARRRVRSRLASSPSPAAARLLARSLVQHRKDQDLLQWFEERERSRHDASPQLAEIAADERESHDARRSALELLSQYGGPQQVPRLAPLRASGDEVLRAYAEAAVTVIEKRAGISASRPRP